MVSSVIVEENSSNAPSDRQGVAPSENLILTYASFSRPPATPQVANATPDFEPDFRIVCRGDQYGDETRLGIRQITQSATAYERFSGVAIELESFAGNTSRGAIIQEVISNLAIPGLVIDRLVIDSGVPPFVTVPAPEKTILFISAKDSSLPSAMIMKMIRARFADLDSETSHSVLDSASSDSAPHILPMVRPESLLVTRQRSIVSLKAIADEAGNMVARLKESTEFPKWRGIHWATLQMGVTAEALRPMMDGANPADCMPEFKQRLGKTSDIPGLNSRQRDLIESEFIRASSELYRVTAVRPAASALA